MLTTESDRYINLLAKFPPRPIATPAQYLEFQAEIDRLLDAETIEPEGLEYLNVLGTLVREYEEKHVPMPDLSGIELLKALIDEFNLTFTDLAAIFETESVFTEVINGDRPLTVQHIEHLSRKFKVSPSIFFRSSLR